MPLPLSGSAENRAYLGITNNDDVYNGVYPLNGLGSKYAINSSSLLSYSKNTAYYYMRNISGSVVYLDATAGLSLGGANLALPEADKLVVGTTLTVIQTDAIPGAQYFSVNTAESTRATPDYSVSIQGGLTIIGADGTVTGAPSMPPSYRINGMAQDVSNPGTYLFFVLSAPLTWTAWGVFAVPSATGVAGGLWDQS